MSKYKIGDKFIVISSNMNSIKIGDILEYEFKHEYPNLFVASGWTINYDLTVEGFSQTKLKLLEEIKMNELNVTPPKGYVIDEENSSFTCIKFKKDRKKEVTCWEDLEKISGVYISDNSSIHETKDIETIPNNKNIFVSIEQTEACIALAMLSQLMKDINGDWIPDWSDKQNKYVIYFYDNKIVVDYYKQSQFFLSFPTKEIRDKFLEHHRELILKAKPLL